MLACTFTHLPRRTPYRLTAWFCRWGQGVTRPKAPIDGSYQQLNTIVVAFLQGRRDTEAAVRAILDSHRPEQIKAVLFNEGERYRRFNHARFRRLVEELRLRGVLW